MKDLIGVEHRAVAELRGPYHTRLAMHEMKILFFWLCTVLWSMRKALQRANLNLIVRNAISKWKLCYILALNTYTPKYIAQMS